MDNMDIYMDDIFLISWIADDWPFDSNGSLSLGIPWFMAYPALNWRGAKIQVWSL